MLQLKAEPAKRAYYFCEEMMQMNEEVFYLLNEQGKIFGIESNAYVINEQGDVVSLKPHAYVTEEDHEEVAIVLPFWSRKYLECAKKNLDVA